MIEGMDVEIFYQQMRSDILERLKVLQANNEELRRMETKAAEQYVKSLQSQGLGLRRRVLSSSAKY